MRSNNRSKLTIRRETIVSLTVRTALRTGNDPRWPTDSCAVVACTSLPYSRAGAAKQGCTQGVGQI
jgi:hypothetical protein